MSLDVYLKNRVTSQISNEEETDYAYSANITHNLGQMADKAGIYEALWRPEEIGITSANELIEPLREGLHRLKSEREEYEKLNPSNGWGNYETLVDFVDKYLNACYEHPNAEISVSR